MVGDPTDGALERGEVGSQRAPLTGRRLAQVLLGLLVLELCVAWLALSLGTSRAPSWGALGDTLGALWSPDERAIILVARLPRVWFAGLIGAALATGGAVFQALLRNPLADPYVLGVSGGAALGGTLTLALGLAAMGPAPGALLGAAGALALLWVTRRWLPDTRGSTYVLLLTGVVFNSFASSVITFLKATLSAQKAQELLFYLMGSLSVEGLPRAASWVVGLVIPACLLGLFYHARGLNVLTLGEEEATALGEDVARTQPVVIGLASVAVAVAVAYTGLIGFVGLIVPHGLRLLFGADHRLLLPACALGGAAFLTGCDLLARASFWFTQTTLPVGVITACLGAPLFMLFLRRALGAGRLG